MTSIYEASAGLKVLPTTVVQQFKFTEAESVLCLGLVQGKSIDDVADENHQPRAILRDQFHNLLVKTGTDNEAKLVTVVLSSAE
jgi:hypothetical protein